ncbi:MAG: glycosyltransferase family 4 protein [Proteobacteria bacterium]|nr:glycosyltransferase family 4 protein [Pseudomonadota bacterium]
MILFATQNFLPDVGGTQLYVTGLADALAKRGHGIEVYCDASSAGAAAKVDAARSYPIRRFWGPRPWMRLTKARAVNRRLARGGVKALITDTWKSLEHLSTEKLKGVRVMCLAHGSEFLVARGSRKERRLIACMAKADIVAANSQFTADELKRYAGGKTQVRVLLPGVTPPPLAPRQMPDLSGADAPHILTIARLEPRKGIDAVLQSLPALRAAHPGLIYDVIGKGDDKARLIALARSLGVGESVRFHGYISEHEKAQLIAASEIFALPNRREPGSVEGFGIVFLEAAAYGVPSLAGADGGTGDAVLEGRTGLVVDAADPKNVETALLKLLGSGNERAAMGKAAHQRFWSEFAWDAAIARFEDALLLG